MIIYHATKKQFDQDVREGNIADKVRREFTKHGITHHNLQEYQAWENSLMQMQLVLDDGDFSNDLQIAIEYQIPMTSRRVDFMIGGVDKQDMAHIVIVELKQWQEAFTTSRNDIVTTFTGGMMRAVTHPSYQAYSYAKTIENYNAIIEDENICLHPCAYLHNFKKSSVNEIRNDHYEEITALAPVFINAEQGKMRKFIKQFIVKPAQFDLFTKIENGKIRPSKALQDSLSSMLRGNKEFVMLDEQKVVFETVRSLVMRALKRNKKYTVIVEGGPGTGKSVVAVQLLVDLIAKYGLNVHYVTKNKAPRSVYYEKLRQDNFKYCYVKNLFKSSTAYIKTDGNVIDCILVDESHRLNASSGYHLGGENQIKEIIHAAKVSVFFIDEHQVVTAKDIGSVKEIKKWANYYGSEVLHDESIHLTSQFRCNGSDGYVSFIDDLLQIHSTANGDGFDFDYDLQIYDDPSEMREALREKNKINNKARMIAGYCYQWQSKFSNDLSVYDIELPGNFRARWNFQNTNTWAIDADSFDQVGCIHTAQGLEFDYVGVIIGKDLRFEAGKVITDMSKRAKSDFSLNGLKNGQDPARADRIIRNTYWTLLTRGQKGCYIYCEDDHLRDYFRQRIKNATSHHNIKNETAEKY